MFSGHLVAKLTNMKRVEFASKAQIRAENPNGGAIKNVKIIATISPDIVPANAPSFVLLFQNRPPIVWGRICAKKGDESL